MTMLSTAKVLQKVTARVFCRPGISSKRVDSGGNPVTIFWMHRPDENDGDTTPTTTPSALHQQQQELARSCEWESVMVVSSPSSSGNKGASSSSNKRRSSPPTLYFYMPSGEQVSFCAHAAMGAAHVLERRMAADSTTTASSSSTLGHSTVEMQPAMMTHDNSLTALVKSVATDSTTSEVGLQMSTVYEEESILGSFPENHVSKLLSDIGVSPRDLSSTYPIVNASVARPKTLIPMSSVEAVHAATPPPTRGASFRDSCDAIHTTGLYLYARRDNGKDPRQHEYECRQFPRASGYAEDPATGIAAAALAVHIERSRTIESTAQSHGQTHSPHSASSLAIDYDIYQGTAMGRPSLIRIRDLQFDNHGPCTNRNNVDESSPQAHFVSWGNVQVDTNQFIEV